MLIAYFRGRFKSMSMSLSIVPMFHFWDKDYYSHHNFQPCFSVLSCLSWPMSLLFWRVHLCKARYCQGFKERRRKGSR